MMAFDRSHDSNGGRFPSHAVVAALRAALAAYLAGDIEDTAVCEALAGLAREAQERRLRAEDMLIAFKRIWNEMPAVQAIPDRAERQRILGDLVRLCIDAFYQG